MRKTVIITFAFVLLCGISSGQELSGELSGALGPGTYSVVGNISVAHGDSLVINPGTTFLFNGLYTFQIFGYLRAVGTEQDSIRFQRRFGTPSWNGIVFKPVCSDSSRMEYCYITNSSAQGIEIYGSSPTISRCIIFNNNADGSG